MKLIKAHDENGAPIWIDAAKVRTVQRQIGDAATLITFDAKHRVPVRETPEELLQAAASGKCPPDAMAEPAGALDLAKSITQTEGGRG